MPKWTDNKAFKALTALLAAYSIAETVEALIVSDPKAEENFAGVFKEMRDLRARVKGDPEEAEITMDLLYINQRVHKTLKDKYKSDPGAFDFSEWLNAYRIITK